MLKLQNFENDILKMLETYVLRLVKWSDANSFQVVHQSKVKVLQTGTGINNFILYEDADRPQHERNKQVHVDVVSGAVKTPANNTVIQSTNITE